MNSNFIKWLLVSEASQLGSDSYEKYRTIVDTSIKKFAKMLLEKSNSIDGFITDEQKAALNSIEASGLDDNFIIKFLIPYMNLEKVSFEAFTDATSSCIYGIKGGLDKGEEYKPEIAQKAKRANVKMSAARLAKSREERSFSASKLSHTALHEFITRIKSGTYEEFIDKLINYGGTGFKSYLSLGHRNIALRDKQSREKYAMKFGELNKEAENLANKMKNDEISQSDYEAGLQRIKDDQKNALGIASSFEPQDAGSQENRVEYIASEFVRHYAGKSDLIYTLFNFLVNCIRQSTLGNMRNKNYYVGAKSTPNTATGDEGEDLDVSGDGESVVKGGEKIGGPHRIHASEPDRPDAPESGMSISGQIEAAITNKSNSLILTLKRCILVYLENAKNILSSKVSLSAKLAILKAAFCFRYLLERIEKDTNNFVSDLTNFVEKEMPDIIAGKRPSVKSILNVNDLYDSFVKNPEIELLRVSASICYNAYDKVNSADALSMLPSNITKDMLVESFGFDDFILLKEACDSGSKFCINGDTDHEKIINLSDKIWITSMWPDSTSIAFYMDNLKNVIFHAFHVWDAKRQGKEAPPIEQCGKLAIKRKDTGFTHQHDPEHHKAVAFKLSGGLSADDQESLNKIIDRLEKLIVDRYYKRVLKEKDPIKQKQEVQKFINPSTLSIFLRELLIDQNISTKVSSEYGINAKPAIQYIIKELMSFIIDHDKNNNPEYQQIDQDEDENPYQVDAEVKDIMGGRIIDRTGEDEDEYPRRKI
jgi:hypothetical protein